MFEEGSLTFHNLVSMLMDSCAVMRGSKIGVENNIRQNHAPNLIDVDGDSVHHLHNAAKKFFAPHSNIGDVTRAIHNDFKWTPTYVDLV